jgi:hypothetical protein
MEMKAAAMSKTKLPPKVDETKNGPEESQPQVLNVENLHYYGNDLRELARLAKVNPKLAEKVVKQRDAANQRENMSYRFAVVATSGLVLGVLGSVAYLTVNAGILAAIASVAVLLAVAVLLRVVLTGEWSDTSWFGKFLNALVKLLGGNQPETDSQDKSDG